MKKTIPLITLCIFLSISINQLFALNVDNIIAYPVPFNPKYQKLNINYKPDTIPDGLINRVQIKIHDINGDLVFIRHYSNFSNIIWNGYNNRGRRVKPGLYIIRVQVETSIGDRGVRIIRIVIVH